MVKNNKNLVGSILNIVFCGIGIGFNLYTSFVLWLALGIGNSLDENFSEPLLIMLFAMLVILIVISIINIVYSSLNIKHRNDKNKFNIVVKILLVVSFVFNVVITIFSAESLILIAYVCFAIANVICFILLSCKQNKIINNQI